MILFVLCVLFVVVFFMCVSSIRKIGVVVIDSVIVSVSVFVYFGLSIFVICVVLKIINVNLFFWFNKMVN